MTGLFANAAETVITPPVGIRLLGTVQASTGVHDDLHARAVVLTCRQTRLAIVSGSSSLLRNAWQGFLA